MIGIIGAMEVEVCSLVDALEERREETVSGTVFYRGRLDGAEVVVARCGIGKVAAAVCAEAMILRYAPDLLVNTGVGGSLTPCLSVTDVAVSDRAVQYDMDTSPLGDPVGLISGINRIYFEADDRAGKLFLACAADAGVKALAGTVASGDRFVASVGAKAEILSLFPDAVVCEMEGAAIAHAAYLNGTPFIIVRAISDSADGASGMDYPTFLSRAAKTSFALTRAFVRAYTSAH